MAKKKFGSNALNALDYAVDTVSDAMETIETSEKNETQPEVTPQLKEKDVKVESRVGKKSTSKPESGKKDKSAKDVLSSSSVEEKTMGIKIDVPMSLYKRLNMFKLDSEESKSLKGIALEALYFYLDKHE